MPNPIKFSFLSGMILFPCVLGCATTNSHTTVSKSLSAEIAATPSINRMLLTAQDFENQGHKDRARLAYEDLKEAYPYSEEAKLAEQRILALASKPDLMTVEANVLEPRKSAKFAAEMTPARIVGKDASAPFMLSEPHVAQENQKPEAKFPLPEIITASAEEYATTDTTEKSRNTEPAPEFLFDTETEVKTGSPKIVTWRESKPEFDWASSGWKSTSQKKTR